MLAGFWKNICGWEKRIWKRYRCMRRWIMRCAHIKSPMNAIGRDGRGHDTARLIQFTRVFYERSGRPYHQFGPHNRRRCVRSRFDAYPFTQVKWCHVHDIAVVGRKAAHRAHRESAQHEKSQMLRCPIQIIISAINRMVKFGQKTDRENGSQIGRRAHK